MRRLTPLLALVLLATACGSSPSPSVRPSTARPANGRLVDVSSVLPVRGAFNRDAGRTRLLLVLSPT
jgi:hypothetical protein